MEKLKDSDIDQAIIDEYEIGETLGTGHFSKVKLGINRKTGEKVAIKVLPPTSRRSRRRRAALGVWSSGAQPALVALRADHRQANRQQDRHAKDGGGHHDEDRAS